METADIIRYIRSEINKKVSLVAEKTDKSVEAVREEIAIEHGWNKWSSLYNQLVQAIRQNNISMAVLNRYLAIIDQKLWKVIKKLEGGK